MFFATSSHVKVLEWARPFLASFSLRSESWVMERMCCFRASLSFGLNWSEAFSYNSFKLPPVEQMTGML